MAGIQKAYVERLRVMCLKKGALIGDVSEGSCVSLAKTIGSKGSHIVENILDKSSAVTPGKRPLNETLLEKIHF